MLNKLQLQIKSFERHSGISQRAMILGTDDLNQCSDEELKAYLEYLRNGRRLDDPPGGRHGGSESGITEADIQEPEPSDLSAVAQAGVTLTDIPETPPAPIAAAPTVPEPDQREKELDALIDQLRPLNRHWKIEWAREKKVPMKALLHASHLWLSDATNDWSAAKFAEGFLR